MSKGRLRGTFAVRCGLGIEMYISERKHGRMKDPDCGSGPRWRVAGRREVVRTNSSFPSVTQYNQSRDHKYTESTCNDIWDVSKRTAVPYT